MKSRSKLLIVGITLSFFISSCTMEKRMYMSGYHIEWLNGKPTADKNSATKIRAVAQLKKEFTNLDVTATECEIDGTEITACNGNEITTVATGFTKKNNRHAVNVLNAGKTTAAPEVKPVKENKLVKKLRKDFGSYNLLALILALVLAILIVYLVLLAVLVLAFQ